MLRKLNPQDRTVCLKEVNAKYQAKPEIIIEKGGTLVINTNREPVFYGNGKGYIHSILRTDHLVDHKPDFDHIEKFGPIEYEITIEAFNSLSVKIEDINSGSSIITIRIINAKKD